MIGTTIKTRACLTNYFYNLHAPDIKEDTTMDANMKKRNELLAKTVIKGLESRNMSGYYAQDKEAALKQALELIPNGSTIAMGGCMSAHEIGLVKACRMEIIIILTGPSLNLVRDLWQPMMQISFYPVPMQSQMTASLSILTAIPTVYPALPRARKK